MKKTGRSPLVPGPEALGKFLTQLLPVPGQIECLSAEEMAMLVDGRLPRLQEDRIMKHIAGCGHCYDIFILTAELTQSAPKEKQSPKKTWATYPLPLRLAASIMVAAFSLFLFYKIVFVPGTREQLEFKPVPGETLRSIPEKEPDYALADKQPAPPRNEIALAKAKGAGKEKKHSSAEKSDDKEKDAEKMTGNLESTNEENVDADRERLAMPASVPGLQSRKEGAQPVALARGQKDQIPVQALDSVNRRLTFTDGYIPGEDLAQIFKDTLTLCRELDQESPPTQLETWAKAGKAETETQKLQPAIDVVAAPSNRYQPNIEYFRQKASPASLEHTFFSLARAGFCDPQGCFGGAADIAKEAREKLLLDWQALKPQLSGVFHDIAEATITHLAVK